MSELISLAYVFGALAAHGVALVVGAAFWPIARPALTEASEGDRCPSQPLPLALASRWLVGVGAIGTLIVCVGLFGAIGRSTILPAVLLGAVVGLARNWRLPLAWIAAIRGCEPKPDADGEDAPEFAQVWLLALMGSAGVLFTLHVLVGGLAPDTGQDSMWYHLMVPQQWVLRGDAAMFDHVMPSCYTVLIESFNAALLLVSDELLVTSFHAQSLLFALVLIIWSGRALGGRLGGWLALAVLCPLYAVQVGVVPITAKHDIVVGFMFAIALWLPMTTILRGRTPTLAETFACGVLSGFAVAGKISVALFWFPLFFALCVAVGLTSRSFATALRFFLVVGVSAFTVYAPWLVRAWIYTGNPLFQVAPRLFPFDDRFLPVVEALEFQVRMFPLTPDGIAGAIADIPIKLKRAAVEMFPLYFVVPIGAVAWLTRRDATRWFGAALLFNFAIVAMLRGSIETVRYGSIFFLAALPVVAWMLSQLFQRVSPRLWLLLILCCFAAGTWTYTQRQIRWGNFHTINWRYRPIVDPGQQLKWLSRSELHDSARPFHFVQHHIPQDAGVLMVDHPGPYYLRRRAWWCDYICKGWINDMWSNATPEEIIAELNERDLEYVLILDWVYNYPPLERALEAGALEDAGFPGWTSPVTLLRVASRADTDQ